MNSPLFLSPHQPANSGNQKARNQYFYMPLFRITTKCMKNSNGVRIEPGMSVDVVTNSFSNPVITNGGQVVVDAFMRIYGIDIKKAGVLSTVYLDTQRIS